MNSKMNFKLTDRYKHKLKTVDELQKILGKNPRKKKVIMCHGVFDVVHPGHLRHLLYARSKASILVASITPDKFINKGIYRPHIPEDLRAINLAAFEIVDYVIIDDFATPINNLRKLQPDLFAKGYEYTPMLEHNLNTLEEINVVREYGGEVIFTPGDVVYSSSNLIEMSPPELKTEKLMMLMSRHSITFNDLHNAIDQVHTAKVHVVGDTIIDSYTNCEMIGGQTKTPTMSVKYESKKDILGGAGIVAEHLKAAGAQVTFTTVVGSDDLGKFAKNRVDNAGIKSDIFIDVNRPTTNKNAIVVGNYRLLKIDSVDNSSINDELLENIKTSIKNSKSDAIILSDFRHGIFNRRTIQPIIDSIPNSVYKVADSQVASRWGNILDFKKFDLVTPNEREARFALGDQDSGIRPLAIQLFDECETNLLILKLGERGILSCLNNNHESFDSFLVLESFANHVIDPVGAGDAMIAYTTLVMVTTKNPVIASIIGNLAAGCECEHDGNQPIGINEIKSKLISIQKNIESGI